MKLSILAIIKKSSDIFVSFALDIFLQKLFMLSCLVPFWFLKREFLGIHPDRIHKLMISTNVSGKKLEQYYKLEFTMDEAISDWFNECGQKGLF